MKKIITQFLAAFIFASFIVSPVSAASLSEPTAASANSSVPANEKVNAALKEYKSLSRKEKKERIKEAKSVIKKYKADKKAGKAESDTNTVLLVILAIFLPPLAVYLHENE